MATQTFNRMVVTVLIGLAIVLANLPDGYAANPSIPYAYDVYAFYDPNETIVLFNDQNPASPLYVPDAQEPYDGAGYRANYPEFAFITLVAVKKRLDDSQVNEPKLSLYDGSNGPIRLKIKRKPVNRPNLQNPGVIPYQLVNLTQNGLQLSNIGGLNEVFPVAELRNGIVNWKGLYIALGASGTPSLAGIESLKGALASTNTSDGTDAPGGEIEVSLGEANGPIAVIAVKVWNFKKEILDFPLVLENLSDHAGAIKVSKIIVNGVNAADNEPAEIDIRINADNVNLVRERPSDNNDPGKFVVEGTETLGGTSNRLYSNIIYIKTKEARNQLVLPGGGGVDWLQVAAADIYNNPPSNNASKVFKWVKNIKAEHLAIRKGFGETIEPLGVCTNFGIALNPFREELRSNDPYTDTYNFRYLQVRDSVCFHESFHSYHDSSSKNNEEVKDTEFPDGASLYDDGSVFLYDVYGDKLYVGSGNTRNELLKFSYDDRSRGFLNANKYEDVEIEKWLRGVSGDKKGWDYFHANNKGIFITKIYDGRYSNNQINYNLLEEIFGARPPAFDESIPTEIPGDLPPQAKGYPRVIKVFIYKPPADPTDLDSAGVMYNCGGDLKDIVEIKTVDEPVITKSCGSYVAPAYRFFFRKYECFNPSDTQRRAKKYMDLLINRGYELYVLYETQNIGTDYYPKGQPTYEYDASYFGITHGRDE